MTTISRRRIATIAVLIATGGAAATADASSVDGDSNPAGSTRVSPSPQVMREYVETIEALYGPTRSRVRSIGMTRPSCGQGRRPAER